MTSFRIDKTVDIDAPAPVVWTVLTDFARYREWNPFVVAAQCDFRPGGAIDMQVKLGRKPQHQVEEIVEVTAGKGFVYRMKPAPLGALRSLRAHTITPLPDGRSRYRSYFELDGWLVWLVLLLFRAALERGFAGMTEGLKVRAERIAGGR